MEIFASSDVPPKEGHAGGHRFTGEGGKPIVGFCLCCGKDFHSMEEVEAHNADDMVAYSVFQLVKD